MTDSYRPLFNTRENGDVSRTSTPSANNVSPENVSTSTTGGYNPTFNTHGGGTSQAATSSANNVSPESALSSTTGGYNPTFNTRGSGGTSQATTSSANNVSPESALASTTGGYNPIFNTYGGGGTSQATTSSANNVSPENVSTSTTGGYNPTFNTHGNGDTSQATTSSANNVSPENVSTSTTGGYNPTFNTHGGGTSQATTSSANNVSPENVSTSTTGGYNPTFNTHGNGSETQATTSSANNVSPESALASTTGGYNPTFNTHDNGGTSQATTSSANNVSPESALASTAGGYNPTFNTQGNEDASSTSTSPATNESTEAISTATTPGYNPTFNTQGNETTSTGLSAANDTTIAVNSSDTLKTFITSLGSFLKTLATQIRNVTPNATDENFQQLQENLIGKTILTAKQAKETLDSFANVLDALAELTESTAQEIDSLDIPTVVSSSGENRAGETVMLSLNSSESEGNSSNESTTAASDYSPTSPGESTIDLTPTETSNISLESATNTTESSLEDAPSDSGQLGETSLSSAESQIVLGTESPNSTPANQLPADSPVSTDGPTKPVGNALYIPNQSPAYTMLSASMDDIRATYPSVPINNSIQAEIAAELMGQNTSYGSQQPADTIHLTDQQVRILSEAIAHNINVRRQMAAQEMIAGMNLDGFGYDGADFELGSVSNDFQQAVLDICDQVIQAGLPYAWGGGSLDGPSQGISDGGGYADACGDYAKIGFDCSGFSRYVFYQATGVELPRVAQAQCDYSVLIDEPMIGDLGFPSNYNPGHVVVYVGNGEIAEAQQSGTNLMYSPASPSYVWKRPPESPNWDY